MRCVSSRGASANRVQRPRPRADPRELPRGASPRPPSARVGHVAHFISFDRQRGAIERAAHSTVRFAEARSRRRRSRPAGPPSRRARLPSPTPGAHHPHPPIPPASPHPTPSSPPSPSPQEPHKKRRKEILAKYPQIEELYGPDWTTCPQIFAVVAAQLCLGYYLGNHASTTVMLVCAYVVGGFATANLFLANHELSHNLAFASTRANRALGLVANLPIGIPFSVAFKKYHLEHHMYQGHDQVDTDIPTRGEAKLFSLGGVLLKVVWVVGQLFFYAIRPLFVRPKEMGTWDFINLATQLAFDLLYVKVAGARAFAYLLASVFLGGGLHPIAGHFISEHYVFEPGQETYSYYGPLNVFVYNVGYHNEHHDFPRVPGSRLHKIREIAPEYYDTLKYHTSWTKVIADYILDPGMGPFARTMRKRQKTE